MPHAVLGRELQLRGRPVTEVDLAGGEHSWRRDHSCRPGQARRRGASAGADPGPITRDARLGHAIDTTRHTAAAAYGSPRSRGRQGMLGERVRFRWQFRTEPPGPGAPYAA